MLTFLQLRKVKNDGRVCKIGPTRKIGEAEVILSMLAAGDAEVVHEQARPCCRYCKNAGGRLMQCLATGNHVWIACRECRTRPVRTDEWHKNWLL